MKQRLQLNLLVLAGACLAVVLVALVQDVDGEYGKLLILICKII